jgi:hypothetical protein
MPGFDEDSAKRIAQSVRYTERLQGVPSSDPNENYGAAIGGQISLVQTDATLPAGYNGAMGAPGQVVEKQADGTINKLGAIWLKDQNGGTLSASTIYQARIGGTWTQDVTTNGIVKPTTLGLYLVQAGAAGSGSNLGPGSFISGNVGPNYNGSAAVLYFYNSQNFAITYTLLNVSAKSWQITTVRRFGVATVVDPVKQTANIVFFSPIVFFAECIKTTAYNSNNGIMTVPTSIEVIDPLYLSIKFSYYNNFNALLFDMGQPGFPPSIGMVTNSGWQYGSGVNPFYPYGTDPFHGNPGIGSGISTGISGV